MTVAAHLNIQVVDYDARIRTFVPHYEHMIATAAETLRLLDAAAPKLLDLGVGTGALAARCLAVRRDATLIGIDADPAMLEMARARLAVHAGVELRVANFLETSLPACDAVVACLALHHVGRPEAKQQLYASCHDALRAGGLFVSADFFPARDGVLAARQFEQWVEHLERTYSRREALDYLESWAQEDTFFPLDEELQWLRRAGLHPEVLHKTRGTLMASSAQYRRLAFALGGVAMIAGGAMHPPGLDSAPFMEHTAEMLRSPMWPPSHVMSLLGSLLLLMGLLLGRRDADFVQPIGPRLLRLAIVGNAVWCVEGLAHLLAFRDLDALSAGAPTPTLTAHLTLAVVAYPFGNFPLALLALRLGRIWGPLARVFAWLGAIGGLVYGVSAPIVVLTQDQGYAFLFPIGAILVAVWLLVAGLVR
jgi:tRNA (cmo5U34)-methyltransferase